jgi:hypothetical protein
MAGSGKTFVVEHLDPELEEWSSLEYSTIASESHASGAQFLLSSVPMSLKLPANLQGAKGLNVETRGIEEIYAEKKDRVCLLDPAASKDLCPEDGETFDIFLFGGILGKHAVLRPRCWQTCFKCADLNQEMIRPEVRDTAAISLHAIHRLIISRRPDLRAAQERLPRTASGTRANDYRHSSSCNQNLRAGQGYVEVVELAAGVSC